MGSRDRQNIEASERSDPLQTAAALSVGSIGLLSLGLQPLLLEPLVAADQIAEGMVGLIATVEVVSIAIGSLVGLRLLRLMTCKALTMLGALGFAASGLVLIFFRLGHGIVLDRAAAGLFEGTLVSVALVVVARAPNPQRLSALFLTGQTLLQLTGALLLSRLTWPRDEISRGYCVLVVAALVAACLSCLVPPAVPAGVKASDPYPLSNRARLALVASGFYQAAIIAIWVHLGLWLADQGVAPEMIGRAVALALACQIVGGAIAARIGSKSKGFAIIVSAASLQAAATVTLMAAPISLISIYAWCALFFGLALFTMPSFTSVLVQLDPQRRAVTYTGAVQLAGAAAGPAIASQFVYAGSTDGAFYSGCVALMLAVVLLLPAQAALRAK